MFFIKINVFISFAILMIGCAFSSNQLIKSKKTETIILETPNTKYNLILKKYLSRTFDDKVGTNPKLILKSNISFTSSETLSSNGSASLKSTKGEVQYSLIELKSGRIIQSGSIVTYPALSSSSTSLYTKEISVEQIKERLSLSSAKKLYMHVKLIIQKLN